MLAATHIQQALQRTALFQLQSILNAEMKERMEGTSTRYMDEEAFLGEILSTPSSHCQAVRDLITIIYSSTHKLLTCDDPYLSPSVSEKAAKQ